MKEKKHDVSDEDAAKAIDQIIDLKKILMSELSPPIFTLSPPSL